MWLRARTLQTAGMLALLAACVATPWLRAQLAPPVASQPVTAATSSIHFEVLARQSCEGLGACQGASIHDGFLYLYGDLYRNHQSGPGVIRQYSFAPDAQGAPRLNYTGLEILLTRRGETLINHPTGLTWNPTFGTFLGNTVTKTKKGTIYRLDWTRMIVDRNLDNAVLNVIDDDLAVQGCRPEFVRHGDRWLLATADYGSVRNAVRIYDPACCAPPKRQARPACWWSHFRVRRGSSNCTGSTRRGCSLSSKTRSRVAAGDSPRPIRGRRERQAISAPSPRR